MCDEDGKGKKNKPPALEIEDEELAELIHKETGVTIECGHQLVGAVGREHGHELAAADEIIIESQLQPLDLPAEYRQICIVSDTHSSV